MTAEGGGPGTAAGQPGQEPEREWAAAPGSAPGRKWGSWGKQEGCLHGATANLSVPICVAKRGSPKVAELDIPDLGARGKEGQEGTAERDAPKPRTLLLQRSAPGSDPREGRRRHSRPHRALRSRRLRVPQTRSRGPGSERTSEAKRKKNKFLRLEVGVFFFFLWGSVKGTSGFCTYFFVVVKLTSRGEKGGGSCKGGWAGAGRLQPFGKNSAA